MDVIVELLLTFFEFGPGVKAEEGLLWEIVELYAPVIFYVVVELVKFLKSSRNFVLDVLGFDCNPVNIVFFAILSRVKDLPDICGNLLKMVLKLTSSTLSKEVTSKERSSLKL